MNFSQHRLELISKVEFKKPPASQSSPKEYGLITTKDARYEWVVLYSFAGVYVQLHVCVCGHSVWRKIENLCLILCCSVPSSSSSHQSYSDEAQSSKTLVQVSSDDRESLNRASRERKRHVEHTNKSAKRRKHDRDAQSSKESDSHLSKSSSSHSEDNSYHGRGRERLWVAPNLRVRIVDRKFKRGTHYNTKVRKRMCSN